MQIIPFLCVFISTGALLGDDVKNRVQPSYNGYMVGGAVS